jgi:hypothetical protein
VVKKETQRPFSPSIPDWHDGRTAFPDGAAVVSRAAHLEWLLLGNTGLRSLVMGHALRLEHAEDR